MAVHKRTYRAYDGPLTPRWSRFTILMQYSKRAIFASRMLTFLFFASLLWPALCIAGLYLNHNAMVLAALHFRGEHLFELNNRFLMGFMGVQGWFAFLSTAFIAPSLVAPDLANNALPLYFCRPISRPEYMVGRGAVLVYLLSLLTWVPGLLLFGIEGTLSGGGWAWEHRGFAGALFFGFLIWILFLTLLGLALSAWVRWKILAGGLLLAFMFVNSGFAAAFNAMLRTRNGFYFDATSLVATIWANLLDFESPTGIPTANACIALGLMCCVLVYLLQRRVRAYEVVR